MKLEFPFLIDGGLSTVLEKNGHNLNHILWSASLRESDPEAIIQAHLEYIQAGSQCITTASYQASINSLEEAGYSSAEAERVFSQSVELGKAAIDRATVAGTINYRPLIALSIGPYGAYLADGSEYHGNYGISNEELIKFHDRQIQLIDHTDADLFACETIPSFEEAKALRELLTQTNKSGWVSFSCRNGKEVNDGTSIEKCVALFTDHPNVFAIGVNCTDPDYVAELIVAIKKEVRTKNIIVYPNSGECYDPKEKSWDGTLNSQHFIHLAKEWISLGADIIGGCCRIGPNHIRQLKEELG